ncbi:hypothetical protein ACTPOK_25975 [Streptomyces inhibens]|uniref:hypothetical protein n=1 Tax=Streptomyces inhibens TaxID=2293571 RepID=UPI00402AAA75
MRADLEQKVAAVLPAGEVYLGGFTTARSPLSSGTDGCDVPDRRRPVVLADGRSSSGDFLGKLGEFFFRAATSDVPSPGRADTTLDPAKRAKSQKKKKPFFGGWDSMAGQWLAAAQPRAKVGIIIAVALTERNFQFVYAQHNRWNGKLDEAIELGASFRRDILSWTRLKDGSFNEVQFGFSDGSWGTLLGPDAEERARFFPHMLGEGDAIP